MTDLFTVRKYRDQWTFKSPFTGEIIAEGKTGTATYLVKREDDRYVDGETVGHITVKGAITEDPVPALASVPAGKTTQGARLVVGPTDQLTENPPTT